MLEFIIKLGVIIGASAFVWGLKLMSSPDTARKGNMIGAFGMGLAIVLTLVMPMEEGSGFGIIYLYIFGGLVVGSIIGYLAAVKVQMTAMPQLVSIFNGFGGAAAVVLAMAEIILYFGGKEMDKSALATVFLALLIGAIAFTGSLLAYLKLDGRINDNKITFKGHNIVNMVLLLVILGLGTYFIINGTSVGLPLVIVIAALALIYGWNFVAPIGGADMPVVISLLNSFSGLSAAAAGLVYGNTIMIVGGILVGAAGTILTVLMCEAMNRSLLNVLIGGFGGGGVSAAGADGDQVAKEVTLNDAAIQLFYSSSVMVVPGYGLAVAQAQKVVKELDDLLSDNGVDVTYAIHPVAGRMPGHMNVLLAEADVPYPKLLDLEDANAKLPNTDMVIIVGANDVVNPAAYDDPGSPIYGMPVLDVWKAKNVIIMKRSMNPGYAGIQNPLFFKSNSAMLFGDAKDSMSKLVSEIKSLA